MLEITLNIMIGMELSLFFKEGEALMLLTASAG